MAFYFQTVVLFITGTLITKHVHLQGTPCYNFCGTSDYKLPYTDTGLRPHSTAVRAAFKHSTTGAVYVFFQETYVKVVNFNRHLQPILDNSYPRAIAYDFPQLKQVLPEHSLSAAFEFEKRIYLIKRRFIWCYDLKLKLIYGPVDFKSVFAFFSDPKIYGQLITAISTIRSPHASPSITLFFIFTNKRENQRLFVFQGNTTNGEEILGYRKFNYAPTQDTENLYLRYSTTASLVIDNYTNPITYIGINFQDFIYSYFRVEWQKSTVVNITTYKFGQHQIFPFIGCPVSLCSDANLDALSAHSNESYYVFRNNYYWNIFDPTVRNTQHRGVINVYAHYFAPKLIQEWQKVPGFIDSAFTDNENSTYIIKEDMFWRHNTTTKKRIEGPKRLNTLFGDISRVESSYFDTAYNCVFVIMERHVLGPFKLKGQKGLIFRHPIRSNVIDAAFMGSENILYLTNASRVLTVNITKGKEDIPGMEYFNKIFSDFPPNAEWNPTATHMFDCLPFFNYRQASPYEGVKNYEALVRAEPILPNPILLYLTTTTTPAPTPNYNKEKLLLRVKVALIVTGVILTLAILSMVCMSGFAEKPKIL